MSRARPASLALAVALAGALGLGCDDDATQAPVGLPAPNAPVALEVAGDHVTATTVASIAQEQGVDPRAAVELALFDATLAAAARRELDGRQVHLLSSSVLARALLTEAWQKLRERPIRAEELEEATQAFWLVYARPEGRRTTHAIARAEEKDAPDVHARAEATARAILEAVREPTAEATLEKMPPVDPEVAFTQGAFAHDPIHLAFSAAARAAVPADVLPTVVIQELPPVDREGRQLTKSMSHDAPGFDAVYTHAAWELERRGQLSGVVKTQFGYHVIVLLEKTPALVVNEATRRAALRDMIFEVRGKRHRRTLLAELEKKTKIELSPNHEALLGQIRVQLDTLAQGKAQGSP